GGQGWDHFHRFGLPAPAASSVLFGSGTDPPQIRYRRSVRRIVSMVGAEGGQAPRDAPGVDFGPGFGLVWDRGLENGHASP
ncbi:MAG: hypothetical protein NTX70_10025, partial [Verrucomicrobia bacterium]|nr:hypothetical protein [Verrucomicrobiota bacterium]